jgi:hypothetical protein
MSKTLLRHTLIKKIFFTFLLTPYLYTFSLYENPSFIIVSAETEYISTRSWYRNNQSPDKLKLSQRKSMTLDLVVIFLLHVLFYDIVYLVLVLNIFEVFPTGH